MTPEERAAEVMRKHNLTLNSWASVMLLASIADAIREHTKEMAERIANQSELLSKKAER